MSEPVTALLEPIVGPDRLLTDAAAREFHSTDLYGAEAICRAVVRPADAATLAAALAAASAAGLDIVPRGGGLTYVGGYTPSRENSVVIDCQDLNRIVEVNPADMYIVVEAGVTWKQIHEALSPLGLRLPFFGTFSGAGATVGGGLSNGAMFLGSARYGSAAEIVLGLEVALADGTLVRTGHLGIAASEKPFYRTYGPDLTGLFVHDAGALGVKTRAALRIIHTPEELDYLSFLFPTVELAARTMSEIARRELTEEMYIVDPVKTRQRLQDRSMFGDLTMLGKVIGQEKGILRGLRSGFELVKGGRNFLDEDLYSLHMVCAGRSRAAVEADVAACRAIAGRNQATEIPNSVPKATRAMPFPDLAAVLGTEGDRWVAYNCKVAHSDAERLLAGTEAIFARHKAELDEAEVVVTLLMSAMSNHVFSYECVFRWFDEWLPLHKAAHPYLDRFKEPAANPRAREVIGKVRKEVIDFFQEVGAASNQIGRVYPYLEALEPETRSLVVSLKRLLDPDERMNPGALGLGLGDQLPAARSAGGPE